MSACYFTSLQVVSCSLDRPQIRKWNLNWKKKISIWQESVSRSRSKISPVVPLLHNEANQRSAWHTWVTWVTRSCFQCEGPGFDPSRIHFLFFGVASFVSTMVGPYLIPLLDPLSIIKTTSTAMGHITQSRFISKSRGSTASLATMRTISLDGNLSILSYRRYYSS